MARSETIAWLFVVGVRLAASFAVAVAFSAAFFWYVFRPCFGIPPSSTTYGRMLVVKRSVIHFAFQHSRMPDNLDELVNSGDLRDARHVLADGWGYPLKYARDGNRVTLTSVGPDGVLDAPGTDRDMVQAFAVDLSKTLEENLTTPWIEDRR